MSGPIWIADISNWQAGISIEQIVAEGYAAIICKASEGGDFLDGQFDAWIPRIRDAGAIPGAYHYLRAGDGAAQARILHRRVAAHGGPAGFLVACDNEADAGWDTTVAFVAEWHRVSGGHPLIMYSGAWWWSERGWPGASLTPHLWHSRYVDGSDVGSALYDRVPDGWWRPGYGGWEAATLLQFTSAARVAGQAIDVSAFRGSLDELRVLTGAPSDAGPGNPTDPHQGVPMLLVRNGPSIVLTDWHRWHDRTIPYEQCTRLAAAGVPLVDVTETQMTRILALAPPGTPSAASEARDLARQVLDTVARISVGGVDPAALAAALAPHLPAPPTVAEIAKAVVDDEATRLGNG